MSETPQAAPTTLTSREIADLRQVIQDFQDLRTVYVKLNDAYMSMGKQMDKAIAGAKDEALANEQMRAYRLLRLENESAQNFAEGFFNRAEPLMQTLAAAENTVSTQIEESATQTIAAVKQVKQQADGSKKLMLQVHQEANTSIDELRNLVTELKTAQDDVRTMINATIKKWNEQTQKITAANVEKAAGEAAEKAFAQMTDAKLQELIDRRIRVALNN